MILLRTKKDEDLDEVVHEAFNMATGQWISIPENTKVKTLDAWFNSLIGLWVITNPKEIEKYPNRQQKAGRMQCSLR